MPLLFQIMALLDMSVDELVFPDRREGGVIHTDGLTEEETEAVRRLVELLRRKGAGLTTRAAFSAFSAGQAPISGL